MSCQMVPYGTTVHVRYNATHLWLGRLPCGSKQARNYAGRLRPHLLHMEIRGEGNLGMREQFVVGT